MKLREDDKALSVEPDITTDHTTLLHEKNWISPVCASILIFLLIGLLGATIIPLDKDLNAKFVFFVAISVATVFLLVKFPSVLCFRKMFLPTIVTAIAAGVALPATSLMVPLNTKYLENFTSLTFPEQIAYMVFAWVLFPVVEEIYFRGFLFPISAGRLGNAAGAVLSIALFVLYHMKSTGMMGLAVQGAIYTWLRHRYGSVSPGILAHSIHNCSLLLIANFRA